MRFSIFLIYGDEPRISINQKIIAVSLEIWKKLGALQVAMTKEQKIFKFIETNYCIIFYVTIIINGYNWS